RQEPCICVSIARRREQTHDRGTGARERMPAARAVWIARGSTRFVNTIRRHIKGDLNMKITVYGRGNVGGGLADLWERAGHQVTRLGRDGGDVSDADVVLLAVPGGAIAEAFDRLRGIEGKTMIDATNLYNLTPPQGFASNAEFV